jgi:M6 family metalloprotease-like protein
MNYKSKNFKKGVFIAAVILILAVARLTSSNLSEARTAQPIGESNNCPVALENNFELLNKPTLLNLNSDQSKTALTSLNANIREKLALYQKTKSATDKSNLLGLLVNRKQALAHLFKIEPTNTEIFKLSNEETLSVNGIFRDCLEKEKEVTGKLEVFIVDFFETKKAVELYRVKTTSGEILNILASNSPFSESKSGSTVKIKGIQLDGYIIPSETLNKANIEIQEPAIGESIIGNQRVLAVLVNFQNTVQPNLNRLAADNIIFNNSNNYYHENSYNQTNLTGSVLGGPIGGDWYTIPMNQTCDHTAVLNATLPIIDPVVDFNQYDYVVVVSPFGPSCSWSGISSVGKVSLNTEEGSVLLGASFVHSSYMGSHAVFSHEIGHAFGNHHASFWNCGSGTTEGNCSLVEYGDPYDVMGGAFNMGHYNALHKENVGWMGGGKIQNITQSGIYQIETIASNTSGIKALKIQRSSNDYLFVEYRQPIGSDSGIGSGNNVFSGVILHTFKKNGVNIVEGHSLLIDPTPPGNNADSALEISEVFVDPLSGNTISVTNRDTESITLAVDIIKSDFTPPTISITDPVSGSSVPQDTIIKASASDQSGISKVEFYRIAAIGEDGFLGMDDVFPFEKLVHFPTIGSQYVFAKATDLAGNEGSSTGVSITITENNPNVCGDADGDNGVNISDAVYIINYIFNGGPAPREGVYADSNGDGMINISDAVYLINYIFNGGPTPVCS